MKKYITLAMFAFLGMFLSAQENALDKPFYYYKSEKFYLQVDYSRISVISEGKFNADNARGLVNASAFNIENEARNFTRQNIVPIDEVSKMMQNREFFVAEIEFPETLSPTDYYHVIEQFSQEDNVIKVFPTYTVSGKKLGISNNFYVKLFKEEDMNTLHTLAEQYAIQVIGYNEFMPLWITLSCDKASTLGVMEAANLFYETGLFASTEPEFLYHDLQASNDPYFPYQWGLKNTGQYCSATNIDIGAESAWDITTGSDIRVAVFDHGIQMDHPDMINNIYGTGYDATTNSSPAQVRGDHGTACAGIIAAQQDNAIGVSGVAPNAQLMSISINLLFSDTPQQLANGFNWAWQNGADVISNSWGGYDPSNIIEDAIMNTLTQGRDGKGTVVVFAAGNENNTVIRYPGGAIPELIVVAAMSPNGERKSPSSCDGESWWGSCYGTQLDVAAPGVKIYTTDRTGSAGYNSGDYCPDFNGTSSACPFVAGVAALILSVNPELTVEEVRDIIESTTRKVGGYDYQTTAGRPNGTWHNQMGYGLVDASAAVMATPSLTLSVHESTINDSEGNNNGNANPGETIKINLSLINNGEQPFNDVNVTITSVDEYVTIINDNASFGAIAVGEIKTVEDAFTVEVSSLTPAKHSMKFKAQIIVPDDSFNGNFSVTCFDYHLNLTNTDIDDAAGNGNGILDPGETADLNVKIDNLGNEPAIGVTGFLTSSSDLIAINSNMLDYGDIESDANNTAPFNVTLDAAAVPGSIYIPFNLLLTDEFGRKTPINFVYKDKCVVVFDLHDSYGDGWNGNQLVVNFSDGTPQQNLTIPGGYSATYTFEINSGVTVSLSWISGSYVNECSFEVYYQGGDLIYSASGHPGSGTFFSWINNCAGSSPIDCESITNLSLEINNNAADLTWDAPASGTPNYYEIYNNFVSVGTTTNTSYSTPLIGNDDEFCVYAVYNNCLVPTCITTCIECPAPSDMVYTVGYGGVVNVSWNEPIDASNLTGYNIYIDNQFIEIITEESYTFTKEAGAYDFCVTALHTIDGIDCESSRVCENIVIIEAPVNLTATSLSETEAKLTWEYSNEEASFILFRDNSMVADNITDTEYIDNGLSQGVEYCYIVKAVVGEHQSGPSNEACVTPVGINELQNNIKIYPNPANGELIIENGELIIENIEVFDVMGRRMPIGQSEIGQSKIVLNVSHLPIGMYIVEIILENGSKINKQLIISR